LKLLVDLIVEHGAETIITAIDGSTPESKAQVVISTAHKSKGREWDRVTLAGDFTAPKEGGECSPGELKLLYLACTRARRYLDVSHVPHATHPPPPARHTPPAPDGETVRLPEAPRNQRA
jgi:superfamily I DNA/RNA helicase